MHYLQAQMNLTEFVGCNIPQLPSASTSTFNYSNRGAIECINRSPVLDGEMFRVVRASTYTAALSRLLMPKALHQASWLKLGAIIKFPKRRIFFRG